MQAFLEYVVKSLVAQPDAVTITPVEKNGMTIYEVRVSPEDMGRIIGKQGVTINAIRSLLQAGSPSCRGLRTHTSALRHTNPSQRLPAITRHPHAGKRRLKQGDLAAKGDASQWFSQRVLTWPLSLMLPAFARSFPLLP